MHLSMSLEDGEWGKHQNFDTVGVSRVVRLGVNSSTRIDSWILRRPTLPFITVLRSH